jgi:hypothetical protein
VANLKEAKEATAAAAATKAIEDEAVQTVNEMKGDQKEEYALYSMLLKRPSDAV